MVKLQKPIPKNLGSKPKLNNPIKEKKQQLKKGKSAITQKIKLLEDSTPVKEAKNLPKPGKEKQNKKEQNGEKKNAKKPLILAPESPQQSQNGKGKKNKAGKEKNVDTNGVKQAVKPTEVPQKVISNEKPPLSKKPAKPAKEVKAPADEKSSAPAKLEPPTKKKPASAPTAPKAVEKKEKAAPVPPKAAALQKKAVNSVPAPPKSAAPQKKAAPAPKAEAPQKKASDPASASSKVAAPKKKAVTPPAPQNNTTAKQGKPGKKQKNKKKSASAAEPEAPVLEKAKKSKKPIITLQEKKKAKIAFKKSKLTAKGDEPKTEKKSKDVATFRYDPIPYDEDKFHAIVNAENIKKIAQALKTTVEKEVKTKKSTIFEDYRYFLQIASFKIPSCPKRMVRLNLKHSLVDKDDDVLLVVPDLQRGGKVDFEPTKHHYEDLLRQNGVEGITVMPMNQLRKEYQTFEQKRRLCATYEYFLCDGRIVAHVGALVGKFTQKARSTFHAVRLNDNKDIKSEIEKSLKKTAFRQLAKSSLQSIPVGTHKFTAEQLAENIELVVDQLKKIFPGGLGNIRNLHLKIGLTGTSSLPLYISMAQAPEETPMVIGPREERMVKLKREANEVLAKFTMTKEGKLIKLTKPAAEKKRKLMEIKAALKEDEKEESSKNAKKAKKDNVENGKKKKAKEVKELELPENEEEDDDDTEDEDDEDVIQLGQGSDDETEDDEMANVDEEDTESGAEIVENGFVGEDDEESEDDDEQEVNHSENDDDDEEEDEDDDDDEEEDDEEESD